jgi:hypothetical protein
VWISIDCIDFAEYMSLTLKDFNEMKPSAFGGLITRIKQIFVKKSAKSSFAEATEDRSGKSAVSNHSIGRSKQFCSFRQRAVLAAAFCFIFMPVFGNISDIREVGD